MHLWTPARVAYSLAALPALTAALTWECDHTLVDGVEFNLKPLGGVHAVMLGLSTAPETTKNTTFEFDICDNLKVKGKPGTHCHSGARVCAAERIYHEGDKEEPKPEEVWPIAGQFTTSTGGHLEPQLTRLKGSDSSADAQLEGVRVRIQGGKRQNEDQLAIFEFICDKSTTGLDDNEGDEKDTRRRRRRDDGDEDQNDDDGDGDSNSGNNTIEQKGPLKLVSYDTQVIDSKPKGVLRVTWRTKYACEDAASEGGGSSSSSGWGFFTWFIVIVFMATSGYLVFGAWLNYNRYGARGWDLLPHGDTIRDVPYILKDWGRKVVTTVQGGGRGGYSAV